MTLPPPHAANAPAQAAPQAAPPPRGWRLFNLVYLLLFFTGWSWQRPGWPDVVAILAALAVFLPLYFHAYERAGPRFVLHAVVFELLAWALSPFAGVHGVFHVYACVQVAFQRPKRRALLLIGGLTLAYAVFALAMSLPLLALAFNLMFGAIVGTACTAAADGLERERALTRARVLERQHAALAERERIAHDLHDLLGHTLTMVALKSDVAAKLVERDPARARREVEEVAEAARKALVEIRAAVYDMTATSVESEIALARKALDAAGVTLQVSSELPPLPPPIGKAIGLTIREATTNIVRHAGASSARIDIRRDGSRLRLSVVDNGIGGSADVAEGAGLSGLRRRVEALGGEASVSRDGGMRIQVSLPLEESPDPGARVA